MTSASPVDDQTNKLAQQDIDTFPALKQSLRYQLVRNLQHSLFGVVKLCWDNLTRQQVCIKVSCKKNCDAQNAITGPKVMESVRAEAAILRFLTKQASTLPKQTQEINEIDWQTHGIVGSQHIAQFIDELEDESFHYLITECCDRDLLTVLLQNKEEKQKEIQGKAILYVGLSEQLARVYFTQLVQAVTFLHLNHVSHVDLSVENVCLITATNQVKLIDFGLAIMHPESPHCQSLLVSNSTNSADQTIELRKIAFVKQTQNQDQNQGLVNQTSYTSSFLCEPIKQSPSTKNPGEQVIARPGKNRYMSPELYAGNTVWDAYSHDRYALGVVLFVLLTGCPAYKVPTHHDRWFELIYSGLWRTSVVRQQLNLQQVYGHLSEEAIDLIDHLIKPEAQRLTLEQILTHPWMQLR